MCHENLKRFIDDEISTAEKLKNDGKTDEAFSHLERAHVLGQSITREHTRVHGRMFGVALRNRDLREVWGQLFRIVGAATKTPLGIYPKGNTGGANVWFFRSMPIPEDLHEILQRAQN